MKARLSKHIVWSCLEIIMQYLYNIELFTIALSSFVSLSTPQYLEVPSDLRYPCQMDGPYQLPVDEPFRYKRQQKFSLGSKLNSLKKVCAADLGIPTEKVPKDLLDMAIVNPSRKVKCLMTCILQRFKLMTRDNLISTTGIKEMADEAGNHNPLITTLAVALSEQFNQRLAAAQIKDQCEAGFLINRYIAKELRDRNMNVTS